MGTHLRVLSDSYPVTGLRWSSKVFVFLCFGRKYPQHYGKVREGIESRILLVLLVTYFLKAFLYIVMPHFYWCIAIGSKESEARFF